MDRWYVRHVSATSADLFRLSVRTGRGFAIDLADCDAPLPRNYADGIREGDATTRSDSIFPCFRFLAEYTQLSILLGRARELRYPEESLMSTDRFSGSLSGMQAADDLSVLLLQMHIDTWLANLPTVWQYSVNLVLDQAPHLMNLFVVALEVSRPDPTCDAALTSQFTFQRCFLWPTAPLPPLLTYRPSKERWLDLRQRAEQAVYWLNSSEGSFYLDVWSNTVYPACTPSHLFVTFFPGFWLNE